MFSEPAWLVPLSGILIGTIMGFVARRHHFCTLSSLERYWYANDDKGLRTWVLAIAVAIAATQLMQLSGIVSLDESVYLRQNLNLVGAIVGGVMFGLGMALTGTCGFGALVRLGSGNLSSLVVVVGIGLSALMTQRGALSALRETYIQPTSLDLSWSNSQSLGDIASALLGFDARLSVAVIAVFALLFWVFRRPGYRTAYPHILVALVIGLCVSAGWYITHTLRQHVFEVVTLEAGSFVLPPGNLIMYLVSVQNSIPNYTVGVMIGVVFGAAISAYQTKDLRWEACDDARELGRHLAGAFLMGLGGVLAVGCTVGQGISAASTLAISAPIVFLSIVLGARLGLSWLLEGSFFSFIQQS